MSGLSSDRPLDIARRVMLDDARVLRDNPLTIATPAQPWAYAVELPIDANAAEGWGPAMVCVDLTVTQGAVEVGCLGRDDAFLAQEARTAAEGQETLELELPSLAACRAVVLRNASVDGTVSKAQVWAIWARERPPQARLPGPVLDLARRVVHDGATALGDNGLAVTTPAEPWAYAVELPIDAGAAKSWGRAAVCVDLTVSEGAVGVACLGHDGAPLAAAERGAADGPSTIELALPALAACRSVVLRNAASEGAASAARVWAAWVHEPTPRDGSPEPVAVLDLGRRVIHEGATVLGQFPLVFATPAEAWAYAVELPIDLDAAGRWSGFAAVRVDLTVSEGAIEIICVGHDGAALAEVTRAAGDAPATVELVLASLAACRAVVFRNGSEDGATSAARVWSIWVREPAPSPAEREAPAVLDLGRRVVHEGARVLGERPLAIATPAEAWAYALELPLDTEAAAGSEGPAAICVDLAVTEGAVEIVCVGQDGAALARAALDAEDGAMTVELALASLAACRAVVIRNASEDGDASVARIWAAWVREQAPRDRSAEPRAVLDLGRRVVHDGARVLGESPLAVETPREPSAYALELPIDAGAAAGWGSAVVRVDLTVDAGAVEVVCVSQDGDVLTRAARTEADGDATVELPLPSLAACRAVVLRNASDDGTASAARVWAAWARESAPRDRPPEPRALIDLGRRVVHEGARVLGDIPLALETPPEAWAYAIELPLDAEAAQRWPGPATVCVDLAVGRGAVGVACLSLDGVSLATAERTVADDQGAIELSLPSLPECRAVVIRNASEDGDASAARIWAAWVREQAPRDRSAEPRAVLDLGRRVVHDGARVLGESPLAVETPREPSAYALELPIDAGAAAGWGSAVVRVDLTVDAGAVEVVCVSQDGDVLTRAARTEADGDATVELPLPSLAACRAVVLRNASDDGTASAARVWAAWAREPAPRDRPPARIVDLARWAVHNEAAVRGDHPLVVETPSETWAYAVEFPVDAGAAAGWGSAVVRVDLTVDAGAVEVVCVSQDGDVLTRAARTEADGDATVELPLPSLAACRAVVLRNASDDGTASAARVWAAWVRQPAAPDRLPRAEVVIDPTVFAPFTPWSGVTPAGYWTDWLGVRTRADVSALGEELLALDTAARGDALDYPLQGERALDWVPLLEAVTGAGETFVIVAVGAGWGRWLARGAFAARQTGRAYRVVGVEAEPTHFGWLERHLRDNGLDPDRCRLLRAPASGLSGDCWLEVGESTARDSPSIVPDSLLPEGDARIVQVATVLETERRELRRVRSVDLEEIVADLATIDYLQLDIPGSELSFLSGHPNVLRQRVRSVNVRTRSRAVERNLRAYFTSLGWVCRYDLPRNGRLSVRLGAGEAKAVELGDGAQVWENVALTAPTPPSPGRGPSPKHA